MWRHGGRGGQDDAHQVHDPGGLLMREEIAHERAGDRHANRRSETLQEAGGDQELYAGRKHGQQARHGIDRHEGEGHRLAPEPVGKRAADELRDGKSREIERQRHLDRGFRGAEGLHDLRHGGCIERHGDRPDGDQHRAEEADAALAHQGRGRCFAANVHMVCFRSDLGPGLSCQATRVRRRR
jgi:hypothetical protein